MENARTAIYVRISTNQQKTDRQVIELMDFAQRQGIEVNPKCCFFATANVGSEYTGTMSMDRALVGRFFPMELQYMPCGEEAKVLVKRFGIGASDAANIVAVAETVRSLYAKQELSCSLSTRETLAAAGLVGDGWSALDAMELTFLCSREPGTTEREAS